MHRHSDHCSHGHSHHHHDEDSIEGESGHESDEQEQGHECSSHHGHSHSHHHLTSVPNRQELGRLKWVFILTLLYLFIEIAGAWLSGSLALLADGFHMFADAAGIGISLTAQWISHRPAPKSHTFGYQRLEILAAYLNALGLLVMSLFILWESVERFQAPTTIHTNVMLPVAIGGFLINLLSLKLLHAGHQHNLNVKGAYLHVFGDLLGSVGAIVAGILIYYFHCNWVDPLLGIVIGALISFSAIGLLRESGNILVEGCPSSIDIIQLKKAILAFEEVKEIHHLHVWNINSQNIVLTAHLVVVQEGFSGEMLNRVQSELKQSFGLSHVTLQLESLK
jgi:cobalt-zinc-cadmium efflux system protein